MNLRRMIADRIRAKGPGPFWMLDVLVHLTDQGVSRDDAIRAMEDFVNEIIRMKMTTATGEGAK